MADLKRRLKTFIKEGLLILLQACAPKGTMLDTPYQVQEVWRSLDEESKRWVYLEACKIGLVIEPLSPLSTRKDWSRVGMLRAYGNAIVPDLAAEFIRAYMDIENKT